MVFYCPTCKNITVKKAGKIRIEKVERTRFKYIFRQAYRCMKGHLFIPNHNQSSFTNSFIEFVVILYLRSLSINSVIQIVRVQFEKDILTKETVLDFIEKVSDLLPTLDDVDNLYHPKRSGYLSFDGVWFKYRNKNFVLLVCFDPCQLENKFVHENSIKLCIDGKKKLFLFTPVFKPVTFTFNDKCMTVMNESINNSAG